MKKNRLSKWLVISLTPLLLSACAGNIALKESFQAFSATYANLSNEQMLINLARRSNGHSSYFMQMSNINASFTFGSTAGVNSGYSRTSSSALDGITKVFTFGGSLGVTATESPTFSFAPLSGSAFTKTIYTPINKAIFFELLGEGVPANQLMRILVVSVTLEYPTGKKLIIKNIPDEGRPHILRNFLRLAGLAREMQLNNVLIIDEIDGKRAMVIPPESLPLLSKLYKMPEYSFWEDSQSNISLEDGVPKVSFVMRTFSGILGALGESQWHFEQWATLGTMLNEIPESERKPILTITWDENKKLTPPSAEAEYLGVHYKIADPDNGQHITWNRDSFMILNNLFSMVSLNPSELPVQQLIKVF